MRSVSYADFPGRGHARRAADIRPSDSGGKSLHKPAGDEKRSEEHEGSALAARRVWDVCRDEATQSDKRMLSGWNKTLDILLIFAGVFSAVATTFIVESNDQLRPDWNEYTARLLYVALSAQIGAGNASAVLPDPSSFAAIPVSSTSRWISGLWVCSLAISLVVALFCILAKQWLIEYHARVSGSVRSAQQWCRQRSLFFVGLEAWRVPFILAGLPALLHLSLFLFMVGMVLFFWALHRVLAICLLAITCCIAAFYLAAGLVTFYDVACPYYISVFHQLHILLGHASSRASSFRRHVAHVTESAKFRLDIATLAWLSAASPEQDVIAAAISVVIDNIEFAEDRGLADHRPNPAHMLHILQALPVVTYNPDIPDPRVDAAVVILHHTLARAKMQEHNLRELTDALSDLCLSYPTSGASPVPFTIWDARLDMIALLAHIATERDHYSLTRMELLAATMSRVWSPMFFGDLEPAFHGPQWLFRLSSQADAVMTPLSSFVASPEFLAANWTDTDIATLGTIFEQPFPDLSIGGRAIMNLLKLALRGNAAFSPVFGVIDCIRRYPVAGIVILESATEGCQPWRQLCCSIDSPLMSDVDKRILAPLLLECAASLGMEIWRQHTGTQLATQLGRQLFDAQCIAPILLGPVLAGHGRELSSSSFILRGRTTGMHSAEHLFLNIMPALLPTTWQGTWEGIIAGVSADGLDPEVRESLRSITLRLQQRERAEVGQEVTQQILSRAIFPPNRVH